MGVETWIGTFRLFFRGSLYSRTNSCAACESSSAKRRLMLRITSKAWRNHTNNPSFRKILANINEKLDILGEVFALNCNAVLIQRIRRSAQICNLYSKIYNECAVRYFVSKFGQRIMQNCGGRRVPLMLGATLFSWSRERVTDEELQERADEVLPSDGEEVEMDKLPTKTLFDCLKEHVSEGGWEKVIDRENLHSWRKPVPGSPHLYEYKVCGTFKDIPARAFFAVQVDLEYRKQWDRLVISLDTVDTDAEEENSEVVRWVTHYPYPMYSREYVYVRRYRVDADSNVMVLVSRAVDHPQFPVNNKFVRVHTYNSSMVIRPHSTFDENGLDYVLTYHDDPQAAIPTLAYNWMATTGVPDFVEKLHVAAKNLTTTFKKQRPTIGEQTPDNLRCYS